MQKNNIRAKAPICKLYFQFTKLKPKLKINHILNNTQYTYTNLTKLPTDTLSLSISPPNSAKPSPKRPKVFSNSLI